MNREYLKVKGDLKIINMNLELKMIDIYSTHIEMEN